MKRYCIFMFILGIAGVMLYFQKPIRVSYHKYMRDYCENKAIVCFEVGEKSSEARKYVRVCKRHRETASEYAKSHNYDAIQEFEL